MIGEESEVWKDIEGFEGIYQVSNLGRVKSFKKWRGDRSARILKGYKKNNYPVIALGNKPNRVERYIHRLVACAFLGRPPKMEVNHKDGCRTNNKISNLEWITHSGNISHAYQMGKCNRSHMKGKVPITAIRVVAINQLALIEFDSVIQCAKYIGTGDHNVRRKLDLNKSVNGFLIYSI